MTEPLTLEALNALAYAAFSTAANVGVDIGARQHEGKAVAKRQQQADAALLALLAAIRSLWEDRARLDWIEANAAHADADEEWDDTGKTWVQVYEVFNGATCAHHSARTLRSAIDAAREKP